MWVTYPIYVIKKKGHPITKWVIGTIIAGPTCVFLPLMFIVWIWVWYKSFKLPDLRKNGPDEDLL